MSRQIEQLGEDRENNRRVKLIKALEYGLVTALQNQGASLRGFSVRYEEFDCLLTLRADFNGTRHVCFVYSDTMMNCIVKADSAAASNLLKWQPDKFYSNGN